MLLCLALVVIAQSHFVDLLPLHTVLPSEPSGVICKNKSKMAVTPLALVFLSDGREMTCPFETYAAAPLLCIQSPWQTAETEGW